MINAFPNKIAINQKMYSCDKSRWWKLTRRWKSWHKLCRDRRTRFCTYPHRPTPGSLQFTISVFILSLRQVKGRTSTDLISTRDLSTGHRFNHVGHHRDGNEEASHVVKHLLSGSLQFFILFCLVFLFYRFDLIVWIPGRGLKCVGSQKRATCVLAMFPG